MWSSTPRTVQPEAFAMTTNNQSKRNHQMNTRFRAMVVAALAVASVFAFSTSAQAGTYTINQPGCAIYGSGGALDGWGGGVYCGPFGATWMTLASWPNYPVGPAGTAMYVKSQRVNNGAALTGLTLTYSSSQSGTADPNVYLRGCLRYQGASDVWSAGYAGQCIGAVLPAPDHPNFSTRAWTTELLSCSSCGGYQMSAKSGAGSGHFAIAGATATITDTIVPSVSTTLGSYAISQGNWLRGTVGFGASSSDTGGGISGMAFVPNSDITQTVTTSPGCNYATLNPCATSHNWTGSFNTTRVADGTQTGRYTATDPGSNTASTANFTFKVDNTNPTTPTDIEPVTDATDGWSSNNSFGSSWTNGAEVDETSTQSGLASVIVDVNPTDPGTQTDPAPVTVPMGGSAGGMSATKTSVSGVTVPATGKWTLRLRLRDAAGNVSDVGDGTGGSANSDVEVGYDPNAPAKPNGNANGWISADEIAAGYNQTWNQLLSGPGSAPICGYAASVSANQSDPAGTTINVPGAVTQWELPHDLSEGNHWVHLRAINCAGSPSATTENIFAQVDLTDPTPGYSGVEDGRWYKDGQQATLTGTDALSGMSPAAPSDLDSRFGAYITYTLNGSGPQPQDSPRGGSATVTATGEGQKNLSFSPVDLAGNKASPTIVNFGIDASKPTGYLESQDPEKPTLVRAPLADGVSGLSNAVLQVRNASGGEWHLLPTSLASFSGGEVGGHPKSAVASARFPDTKLPVGTYQVRAIAQDQAGNELVTSKDKNGNDYTISNPMRKGVGLSAFVYRGLKKCKRKIKSKCVRKKKGRVYLVGGKTSTSVGYRRAGVVQGYLTSTKYAGLARQPIEVYTQAAGKPEVLAGTVSTKADGSYYYRLKPGVSRKVRVYYPGTELLQDAESRVTFGTAAKLTLKVNRKHAFTGQTVKFTGKVTSVDRQLPKAGKIVALQFYTGGKWRPAVAIVRTSKKGKFKVNYRFDRIPRGVKARIRFRVMAPSELGWNHVTSASRFKIVKVN